MRRRDFITLVGGAAATWPVTARAQQPGRTYRLGFVIPVGRDVPATVAFLDELRLHGFIEGQNLVVVPGGFSVHNEQIADVSAAMVRAAPDAITGGPELQLRALQAATRSIPLVGMSEDMVGEGLVASLARPGGNITGISILSPDLDGKRQDLLLEAVPGARRIAALFDSTVTRPQHLQKLREVAHARGVELSVYGVAKVEDVLPAIDAAKAAGAQALNLLTGPLFSTPGSERGRFIIEHIKRVRVPAMHQWPETGDDGGLLAYGSRFIEMFRQRARIVVKVLRGAKPADIPVEQPTRFELVINLQTAKAIGHEVPAGLVLRADRLIE